MRNQYFANAFAAAEESAKSNGPLMGTLFWHWCVPAGRSLCVSDVGARPGGFSPAVRCCCYCMLALELLSGYAVLFCSDVTRQQRNHHGQSLPAAAATGPLNRS